MTARSPVGAQIAAVESPHDRVLVLAPPGCGKTEVLAMRAKHLLQTGTVRPGHRLLALTFTNRARDNLRNRLVDQLGHQRVRASVTVANFHEISARILEAHHATIGIPTVHAVARPAWIRRALQDLRSFGSKQDHDALEMTKRSALTDAEILAILNTGGNTLGVRFQERLADAELIEFGDLQRYAQLILRNDRVNQLFREHFDAMLVDEFQDLSTQQYEIASRLCDRNWTYVGDPYQGIFGWAGADPETVYPDLAALAQTEIGLDVSFRSSPAVLDVVNAASKELGATPLRAADPNAWQHGGHAHAVRYATDDDEASGIVALTDYLANKYPDDTIGVICKTKPRRQALDRRYQTANTEPQFWDIVLDTPKIIRLVKLWARGISDDIPFADQVAELHARLVAAIPRDDAETIRSVAEACEQILEFESDGNSVSNIVKRFRDTQSVATIAPGVHVLNAHVGKGQQFDWVIVMGLEDGHIPHRKSTSASALNEERRVLMVMLSRARKGLFLTTAARVTNEYGTFQGKPSRWWPTLEQACKPTSHAIARLLKATG